LTDPTPQPAHHRNEEPTTHPPGTDPPATDPPASDPPENLGQLQRDLSAARLAYADLVAAARATLTALADHEPDDPLFYLRDELPPPPPGHPLHHGDPPAPVRGC
jgi:hypothetical protein